MESGSGNRLKDIQRRKEERERKARKKRELVFKCVAAVFFAAVIFLAVFGIKSCVGAVSARRAEKEAQKQAESEAQTQLATETPRRSEAALTEGGIDSVFYKNSAFIGNSFIDGLEIYDLVPNADYFARVGLNVSDAMSLSTSTGEVAVIDELDNGEKYDKIFMMFGENELGWVNRDIFSENYAELIKKAKKYQPQARIYLLAITPVTEEVSAAGENGATKDNIAEFNSLILDVAKSQNVNFADIFSAVADDKGYLPKGAATDGIHFGEEYYKKCLVYIQNVFSG